MAKVLVSSIREFGGPIRHAKVFSYSPRPDRVPSAPTLRFFQNHGVETVDLPLNVDYVDYAFANKPLACAHRERESSADILMFLDTDTAFLNPPDFLSEVVAGDVWIRPVDIQLIGTTPNFNDPNGKYWANLYKLLGVRRANHVTTTVDRKNILEYYNSGMVITARANGLFNAWLKNFESVMEQNLQPDSGRGFVEQSVLSATIAALDLTVRPLPEEFNYPVHILDQWEDPPQDYRDFSGKSHLHYHRAFTLPRMARALRKDLSRFPAGASLAALIREHGVDHEAYDYFGIAKRLPRRLLRKLARRFWSSG
ncbi:hypothetical protein [Lewinella sp. IMCC34183]|uniref:hypothetical protein n=1 Tax=Lewinella sp. IMCC34183 TaxID=2248762 RepID=UPI0018E525AD|nr:hypothetical protein [Lewinella sp. IMCC34183]